jgi:hypothetical protein
MTVVGIKDYLQQHWPAIREQLLNGAYEPQPVRRVEIEPDGGVRKLGICWRMKFACTETQNRLQNSGSVWEGADSTS